MVKRLFLIFFLTGVLFSCHNSGLLKTPTNSQTELEINDSKQSRKILNYFQKYISDGTEYYTNPTNMDSLTSIHKMKWLPQLGELGFICYFTSDGIFDTSSNFQGGNTSFSGTYKKIDDAIEVTITDAMGDPISDSERLNISIKGTKVIFKLHSDKSGLYLTEYLEAEPLYPEILNEFIYFNKVWNWSKTREKGEIISFENRDVEIVKERREYRQNTLFYEEPHLESRKYSFIYQKDIEEEYTIPDYWYNDSNKLLVIGKSLVGNEIWYCVENPLNVQSMAYENSELESKGFSWIQESSIKE